MASKMSPSPSGATAASASTPIPRSYAKGVAMTSDPWEECPKLEYGGDRSYAWSINQQVVQSAPASYPKVEEQLLAALGSAQCTEAGCAFLCQMLALVGSSRSVPALAKLLRDPKTTEAARIALEAIPGAEAEAALREALGVLRGDAKAGLIGSIAVRRDPAARTALAAVRNDAAEPPIVRDAAERALACLPAS